MSESNSYPRAKRRLSDKQRTALREFVNKIHELLGMCAHGGVPIEADVFIENHLTPGQIRDVSKLFQEPEDDMPDAQLGVIRFPGSVVWDCNPFVRELVSPWIRYHIGGASPSDVAFLTAEEEENRKTAFRRLREYVESLELVLLPEENHGIEGSKDDQPAANEPPAKIAEIAFRAIRGLSTAHQENSPTAYLKSLSEESARSLLKCLRRNGWWIPKSGASPQIRLLEWMTRDGTRIDFSNGTEQLRIETPGDRIADANGAIEGMVGALCFPRTSCLAVLRIVQALLQRTAQHDPLLFPRFTRNWPDESKRKNPTGGWENVANDPCLLEECAFKEFCHRFDAELLDAEFFEVESNLQLPHFRIALPQPSGHIRNDEIYVKRDIVRWLEGWRDQLLRESQNRRELSPGWEPDGSRWPECPIQNIGILREWLESWLGNIHSARSAGLLSPELYLDDIRRELRNTRRAARTWSFSLPQEFSDSPADINEAERLLELLIKAFGDFDHGASNVPVEIPSESKDTQTRIPNLSNWAFGYEGKNTWYLFHKSNGRWEKPGKIKLPSGLPSQLMLLLAEHGGRLDRSAAIAWLAEQQPRHRYERRARSLTENISRARTAIKEVLGKAGKFDKANIPDPLPLSVDTWVAAVEIGFAIANELGRLEFKRKEDL